MGGIPKSGTTDCFECNVLPIKTVSWRVGDRLFNQKQVREILKRASASQSPGSDGISLEELKQVGAELGFDTRQIEVAAQEVGSASSVQSGLFSGRLNFDQTVDGEIGPEEWLGMVATVQRYYKKAGTITQRGSNYDWVSSDSEQGSGLSLTVTSRDGRSRIRIESTSWLGILFATVMCPVFTLVFFLSSLKHFNELAAALVIFAGFGLMFGLIRHFKASHRQSVSDLMDRLTDELQESVPNIETASPRSLQPGGLDGLQIRDGFNKSNPETVELSQNRSSH